MACAVIFYKCGIIAIKNTKPSINQSKIIYLNCLQPVKLPLVFMVVLSGDIMFVLKSVSSYLA